MDGKRPNGFLTPAPLTREHLYESRATRRWAEGANLPDAPITRECA